MFSGLYHDDIIYNTPEVLEAVRRLPKQMKEERDWRSIRAIQLDLNHELLPEDQWIQYEEVSVFFLITLFKHALICREM